MVSTAPAGAGGNSDIPDHSGSSSYAEQVATNLLISSRNSALASRRADGETDVPPDEELLVLSTPPATPPHKPTVTQMYAALQTFSPTSQKQIRDTLTSTLADDKPPQPKLLFSVANETTATSSFSSFGYGTHPFILALGANGSHIPLSLFTTESTTILHTQEASIPQKMIYNRSGSKRHIIDISHFQKESTMDIGDWHEAWSRYLYFVVDNSDTITSQRWKNHHTFLASQDNFKLNFAAILKFDIEARTRYSLNPKAHDEDEYKRRFEAIKLEVIQASVETDRRFNESERNRQSVTRSSTRFHPYSESREPPRDVGFRRGMEHQSSSSGSANSFRNFHSSGESSSNPPMCLICQREHRFAACKEETMKAGKQTFAKYADRNTSAHSAAPPIMVLARENVSPTLDSANITHHLLQLSLPELLQYLTFKRPRPIASQRPYFNNLQLETSPYDHDPDFSKIKTPYSATAFAAYLNHADLLSRYPELCFKLTHGFPIGPISELNESYTPNNLPSAEIHDDVISKYITDELELGRFAGPFTREQLEAKIGPFRSSPVQVSTKPGAPGMPDKLRCCRNLSYRGKLDHSVNDEIDPEEYPTRWGTATECANIVRDAPDGAQASTLDVEGAYRTIPVKPAHKRFLVVHYRGLFYLDHDVPFGLASASGLQGEVADATVDIWMSLDIAPIIKWVDDFNAFHFPSKNGSFHGVSDSIEYRYNYDLSYIKAVIAPLGIPWHLTKGQEFADSFPYVGFQWDLPEKTVYLTLDKRHKHMTKVQSFLQLAPSSQFFKKDIESLNGSLAHIAFVYLRGRSYLQNLIDWVKTFPNNFTPRWAPPSVISDLRWWLAQLEQPSQIRSLRPRPSTIDPNIWVDASTEWGIGILWQGRWDAWRTQPAWKAPGRDIGWLEAVALELAIIITQAMRLTHTDVLLRSDNEGVIGAHRKGRSRNREVNLSIRRSEAILDACDLSISLLYVETSTNLADPISRGLLPSPNERITIPYSFPTSIAHFFYHA